MEVQGPGRYQPKNAYEAMGGAETLQRLVEAFYRRVAEDPDLAPIFPADLSEVRTKQYRFLTQFFGGPPLYSELHGHPMLRARHLRHPITPRRARAWLACMRAAIDEVGIAEPVRSYVIERLTQVAGYMVNTEPPGLHTVTGTEEPTGA